MYNKIKLVPSSLASICSVMTPFVSILVIILAPAFSFTKNADSVVVALAGGGR